MSAKNPPGIIWLIVSLWLIPATAGGEQLSETLGNGLSVLADYRHGAMNKPAALVLHGFLQTHQFSTVQLIADELSDAGYAVLSPTLSLNISRRRSGLTCDAIQNHTVEQSTEEIAFWVEWLKRKGHKHVILIGHSTGSNNLLSYLEHAPDPSISTLIATAIGPIENWRHPEESRRQQVQAKALIASGNAGLRQYSLSFCRNNYAAPGTSYLSYMQWKEEWLLHALKASPVPVTVVLGKEDKWLPPDWAEQIRRTKIPTVEISEANHYFSGIAEFEFQSAILALVVDASKDKSK